MTVLVSLLPLLALACALAAGRYPGAERLAAARERRAPGRLVLLAPLGAVAPSTRAPRLPRLGLLATRAAGRGPPR